MANYLSENHTSQIAADPVKSYVLFLRVLTIIFVAEFIVMVFLEYLDIIPGIFQFFLDSLFLSVISAPFIYLLVVRVVAKRLREAAYSAQTALKNELDAKALAKQLALKAYADNIVKSVPSGFVVLSSDLKVISVNPSFRHMFSVKEDIAGKSIDEVLPFAGINEAIMEVISTGTSMYNLVFTHSDREKDKYFQLNITEILPEEEWGKQALIVIEDITEQKVFEAKIIHMAYHDNLTGLPNRRLIIDRLKQIIARMQREEQLAVILFLDIDRFKYINDTFGHDIGDEVLKVIAGRLLLNCRISDSVARLGGDEFIILLPDISKIEEVVLIVQRFFEAVNLPMDIGEYQFSISTSIGISIYPNDGMEAETLLKNADSAMYRAKTEGRSNWQFYSSSMNQCGSEWITMENKLRRAVAKGDFILNYQPQVDAVTCDVIGMEALIRWQDPDTGIILPDIFIPVAEDSGLILPIGEWVLRTACAMNKKWQDDGNKHIIVAVNISMRQFKQKNFAEIISRVLNETGLDPGYLELELTESILMSDVKATIKTLHYFKDMGVRLSIDDFGTGYSSLSYLKHIPIDMLKIDRSFVKDITGDGNDAAICTAIISMAKSLKIEVIAEGVETMEQLIFLRNLGCDKIQGYLISKPLSPDHIDMFLHKENSIKNI